MPNFSNVVLVGRLVKDPDSKVIPSGKTVCEFSVVVSKNKKDRDGKWTEEPSFFDCVAFGFVADDVANKFRKGASILVEGELKQSRWQDKSGNNRSKVMIVADKVRDMSGPKQKDQYSEPAFAQSASPDIPGDEIPF